MRQVQMIMAMPVIIDIPNVESDVIFNEVFAHLHVINETFSTYLSTSEVSRYNRHELLDSQLSMDFNHVYKQIARYKKITNGYFDARYNGVYDPSGYVKAWAIVRAGAIIQQHGYSTYLINIAGDMYGSGEQKEWTIALQDPWVKENILGVVALQHRAIATSGSYQQGEHILNPFTQRAETDLLSVSIVGRNIITADVFATACVAMGSKGTVEFLAKHPTYQAYLIRKDGTRTAINGFILS